MHVLSDTQLTATAPAGTVTVTVSVTTPSGTSPSAAGDSYTYEQAPLVTAISPVVGASSGDTLVTVTGGWFSSVTSVSFGGVPAVSFKVLSGVTLLAVAPAGSGTADVRVATIVGTSSQNAGDRYSYAPAATSYAYNGDGLRMSEAMTGGTKQFAWDITPSVPAALSDGNMYYIYGPGGLPIEQIDNSGDNSYFFHDAIGSTRALLGTSGTIGATFTYTAYGRLKASTGTLSTPLLFAQSYSDNATGLLYLINRYYDPQTGQFMTLDPHLGQTGEPFGYAGDDPVNNEDPAGASWWNPLRWHWRRVGEATGHVILDLIGTVGCLVMGGMFCDPFLAPGLNTPGLPDGSSGHQYDYSPQAPQVPAAVAPQPALPEGRWPMLSTICV